MTLNIQSKEDDKRQLNLTVEVDEMRVKKAMKAIARKYAKEARIPGFRPGKAPYHVITQLVGESDLRREALHDLVPDVYEEALKEVDVLPYAQPKMKSIDEGSPAVMEMVIPLTPVVKLGDYRSMRKTITPIDIKDEAVDEQLEMLRDSKAQTETVDRPAEMGDVVVVGGVGYLDDDKDNVIFTEEAFDISLQENGIFPETTFISELVGTTADTSKSFIISFPDEYEYDELAGKKATFNLKIVEVKAKTLPPLDDALAKMADENIESLDALRQTIQENLQSQAESQQKTDLLTGAVETMLDEVEEMAYPQGAVDAEIDSMLEDMKKRVKESSLEWNAWLQQSGKRENDLREDYEEMAVERVEQGLIMRSFIEAEQLTISDEAFDAEVEKRVSAYLDMTTQSDDSDDASSDDEGNDEDQDKEKASMADMFRSFYKSSGRPAIEQEMVMENVHNRLLAIYAGEAPDLPEPTAEPSAA